MSENYRDYGTKERQEKLLVMMKKADELFRANGIDYSLTGGSLLGAIRHRGFIPWDDDIDLMMDRANFTKTCRLIGNGASKNGLTLKHDIWVDRICMAEANDSDDLVIDLCVVDRCPDNPVMQKIKVLLLKTLQGMMKTETGSGEQSLFYRMCLAVTRIMGKLFSAERKYRWYQKIAQIGSGKMTGHVGIYTDSFRFVGTQYSGTLMDSYELRPFEDTELMIVSEFENYLTVQFGDYMTPPPEDQRVPLHVKPGKN